MKGRLRGKLGPFVALMLVALAVFVVLRHGHHDRPPDAGLAAATPSTTKSTDARSEAPSTASTPSVHPSSSGYRRVPRAVVTQLTPFLRSYFTMKSHDTDTVRRLRISSLVPARIRPELDTTFAGIPPGSTMTPWVSSKDMTVQHPKGSDQLYIVWPITVRLTRPDGNVYRVRYETGSVWVPHGTGWQWIDFARNSSGTVLEQVGGKIQ